MSQVPQKESLKGVLAGKAQTILRPYKVRFEKALFDAFLDFGKETPLINACKYALSGDAKRFRSAIVYMISDSLGNSLNVDPAALAMEYFHTASLIADDLPCMDNDDFRRGRATTHKMFNESIALLASFGLIAKGFEEIANNADILRHSKQFAHHADRIGLLAVQAASKTTGLSGLIGGQFLDLHAEEIDREKNLEIIEKKTVSLFELAFVLGWLFGGGAPEALDEIRKCAYYFGTAFQLLDDLDDLNSDKKKEQVINFALSFGKEATFREIQRCEHEFQRGFRNLQFSCPPLSELMEAISQLIM